MVFGVFTKLGGVFSKIIVQLVRSGCPQAIMAADAAVQVLPEKMALFNRSLLENLAALKPMAQLAIPIIELLADAADIPEFHAFFTVSAPLRSNF